MYQCLSYLVCLHVADFGVSLWSVIRLEVVLHVVVRELDAVVLLVTLVPPPPPLPGPRQQHGHHAPQEHGQDAQQLLQGDVEGGGRLFGLPNGLCAVFTGDVGGTYTLEPTKEVEAGSPALARVAGTLVNIQLAHCTGKVLALAYRPVGTLLTATAVLARVWVAENAVFATLSTQF